MAELDKASGELQTLAG